VNGVSIILAGGLSTVLQLTRIASTQTGASGHDAAGMRPGDSVPGAWRYSRRASLQRCVDRERGLATLQDQPRIRARNLNREHVRRKQEGNRRPAAARLTPPGRWQTSGQTGDVKSND